MLISHRTPGVVTFMLLLVAACGGGDSTLPTGSIGQDDSVPSVAQTEAPAVETTAAPDSDNIIDPPLALGGTNWTVTNYELQDSIGLTNVLGNTDVNLEFGVDGQLTGFNTCNSFAAVWVVDGPYYEQVPTLEDDPVIGQEIFITELTNTDEDCPEGFESEQQSDIFASLLGADRWRLSDEGELFLSGEGIFIDAQQVGG